MMKELTRHLQATSRIQSGGVTLELSVCISDEALQGASGVLPSAPEFSGSPVSMQDLDPTLLLSAMQPALAQALQRLRESLVQLALADLEMKVAKGAEESKRTVQGERIT